MNPAVCLAVTLTEKVVSMGRIGGRVTGGRLASVGRMTCLMGLAAVGLPIGSGAPLFAQFQPSSRFELSDTVYVDEPESAARTHLEQVKAYLKSQQWDEAIDVLGSVAEKYGDKLVKRSRPEEPQLPVLPVTQYTNVRDYCQWQIARLPKEALESYRQGVDAQAERAYRDALAARDLVALEQVVRQFFSSSWGDDSLLAWGDLAFEAGDFAAARSAWQRILREPATEQAAGQPAVGRMVFPDSSMSAADIGARLILASILEQDTERAQSELSEFTRLYPTSTGRLGGRDVVYSEALASLLNASRDWPSAADTPAWPTFAGGPTRNRVVPYEVDVGAIAWRLPLKKVVIDERLSFDLASRVRIYSEEGPRRPKWLLSYHPVIDGDLLLLNTADEILAVDRLTGKPAWNASTPVIFRDEQDQFAVQQGRLMSLGAPRFTMTTHDGRLYARMGSPITTYGNEMQRRGGPGFLVCLDLRAEGRLAWKLLPKFTPDDDQWAFEGSPLCDGENVYVAVRHSDVRPQAHVACYEAKTGKLRWMRYLCAAETPGSGQKDESTSNLLTLDGHRLYANTNLGAIAALDARDGRIEWLTAYRRSQQGDLGQSSTHFQRDLNPCIAYRGRLFVAPSDSEGIFAFDAATGDLLWESPHAAENVQLLGVGGGNLIISGDRLYWINATSGKLVHRWPDGAAPKSFGRGVLVGSQVLWPTREELYLLSQKTGQMEKVIRLAPRHPGETGGNLLVTERHLYIAGSDNLTCFSQYAQLSSAPEASAVTSPAESSPTVPAPAAPSDATPK